MSQRVINLLKGTSEIIHIFPATKSMPEIKRFYTPTDNDTDAIRTDWEKVGEDIRSAMQKLNYVR